MPSVVIRGGATIDSWTPAELWDLLDQRDRHWVRAVKYGRFPVLTGTAAGGALDMGGTSAADIIGPAEGYCWIVRHLWSTGLTTGTTPDKLNLLVNNQTWWQLNGNNFAYTFGPGELVLLPGETVEAKSSGTFAATGPVSMGGAYWSVPPEMAAKMVVG